MIHVTLNVELTEEQSEQQTVLIIIRGKTNMLDLWWWLPRYNNNLTFGVNRFVVSFSIKNIVGVCFEYHNSMNHYSSSHISHN